MTAAQVVETSNLSLLVNKGAIQDCTHSDNHIPPCTYQMTPVLIKLFTKKEVAILWATSRTSTEYFWICAQVKAAVTSVEYKFEVIIIILGVLT